MKINIVCQHCHTKLLIKATLIGQKIRCPKCHEKIKLKSPGVSPDALKQQHSIPQDDPRDEVGDVGSDELSHSLDRSVAWDDDEDDFVQPRNPVKQKKQEASTPIKRNRSVESNSCDEVITFNVAKQPTWLPVATVGVIGIILGIFVGFLFRSQQGEIAVRNQAVNTKQTNATIEKSDDNLANRGIRKDDAQPANDESNSTPEVSSTVFDDNNVEPESALGADAEQVAPSP